MSKYFVVADGYTSCGEARIVGVEKVRTLIQQWSLLDSCKQTGHIVLQVSEQFALKWLAESRFYQLTN